MKRVIKKKVWVLAVLVAVVVTMGLFSGCQNQSGQGSLPKKVNIGYLRVPNDEMVSKTKAVSEAYFNELGVPYEFIVFDSGVDANKALASGSIDFATMGNTNGIIALSRGIDVELIWIHEVLGEIEGLAVKKGKASSRPRPCRFTRRRSSASRELLVACSMPVHCPNLSNTGRLPPASELTVSLLLSAPAESACMMAPALP